MDSEIDGLDVLKDFATRATASADTQAAPGAVLTQPAPELAWGDDAEDLPDVTRVLPPMPASLLPQSWRATVGIAASVLAACGVVAAVVAWPDSPTPTATVPTTTTTQAVPTQAVAPAPPVTATVTVAVPAPTTVTATVTQQPAAQSTPRVAAPPTLAGPFTLLRPGVCVSPNGTPTPQVRSPYEGGGVNC